MGRNFFTGGVIPSTKMFYLFTQHLVVERQWVLKVALGFGPPASSHGGGMLQYCRRSIEDRHLSHQKGRES